MNTAVTMALATTGAMNVADLRILYDALKETETSLTTMNTDLGTQLMQAQTERDDYKEKYETAQAALDAMEETDTDMVAQVTGERLAPAVDAAAGVAATADDAAPLDMVIYQQLAPVPGPEWRGSRGSGFAPGF